jgi:hypothetical protein
MRALNDKNMKLLLLGVTAGRSHRPPRSASGPDLGPAAERSLAFPPSNPLADCTSVSLQTKKAGTH